MAHQDLKLKSDKLNNEMISISSAIQDIIRQRDAQMVQAEKSKEEVISQDQINFEKTASSLDLADQQKLDTKQVSKFSHSVVQNEFKALDKLEKIEGDNCQYIQSNDDHDE